MSVSLAVPPKGIDKVFYLSFMYPSFGERLAVVSTKPWRFFWTPNCSVGMIGAIHTCCSQLKCGE